MSQTTFSPDPPRTLDSRVTGGGVTIDGTRPRQTEVPASNVLRAERDTAKEAVSNIRS
jgi:hypothetical protein